MFNRRFINSDSVDPTSEKILTSSHFFKTLAQVAKEIQTHVKTTFQAEATTGPLHTLFSHFSRLIPNLNLTTFADLYAQTITYVFFFFKVARLQEFTLEGVLGLNPFLRTLFKEFIRAREERILGIAELDRILNMTDLEAVLQDDKQQLNGADPVIHFYELFLKEYNPKQKIQRGVFYTPAPVVSFIVKSTDHLLRTELNYPEGLADSKVQILDPAMGTGTFLYHIIEQIKTIFDEKKANLGQKKLTEKWIEYVSTHLLPRLHGSELMMAPYIIAHLKLGLKLAETGYDFKSNHPLRLSLHNTLAEPPNEPNKNLSVIIGNPPYQVNSLNSTPYIQSLMKLYKEDVKSERYIKPLSDDYIKFLRFAHHMIETTGYGIIGMVTNHGFLSGLIHRGMRRQLLEFFDKIYILDLHGNRNIGETCPDGSEDQNVFDIQQGVAISLFLKLPTPLPQPELYHLDLWGSRQSKYQALQSNDLTTLSWNLLQPLPPNFFFIPLDTRLANEYGSFPSLKDLFQLQRIGILTNRDWLTIDFSYDELKQKLHRFFALLDTPKLLHVFPQLTDTWWDYSQLRDLAVQSVIHSITKCLFRPFDTRYITYHPLLLNRARKEVMDHVDGKENLVLIASRHYRKEKFNSCFISESVVEQKAGESTRGSYAFPLYSYYHDQRRSNLTPLAQAAFKKLASPFDEKANLGYIYAILHSNGYRTRYQEYLKLDFPRIPITENKVLFERLAELGNYLISLHLLKQTASSNIGFLGAGNNQIQKGFPKFKNKTISINPTQYFQGISPTTWTFLIGGYPVCQKWLKDRRGRTLTELDIQQYHKILSAITTTLQVMAQIDKVIETQGGWPLS